MKVMVKKFNTKWIVKCNDVVIYLAYDWKIALEYAVNHANDCMLQNPQHRKVWR